MRSAAEAFAILLVRSALSIIAAMISESSKQTTNATRMKGKYYGTHVVRCAEFSLNTLTQARLDKSERLSGRRVKLWKSLSKGGMRGSPPPQRGIRNDVSQSLDRRQLTNATLNVEQLLT